MAKSFACRDIGMSCNFTATGPDEETLLKKIASHARKVHGVETIDEATMAKIKAAIKEA